MDSKWVRFFPYFIRQHLEGRSYLQNVLNNIGWLFSERILQMGVGLFVGVWMARYLRPGPYGVLNYAMAFAALFSPIATLGMDGIVVRNLVRDPSKSDTMLGTAFILRFGGGIAGFLIIIAAVILVRPGDHLVHWLAGIIGAGLAFQAFDVIRFWYESQVRSRNIVFARNAAFCAMALVKVVLILFHAPLIAFAWALLAEIALTAFGFSVVYHANGRRMKQWQWNTAEAKTLVRESWPLFLSSMAFIVYMKIDQVMLGNMAGDKEVGIYSAAVRLSEIWYFIPVAIVSSVSPSIVEAKRTSEDLYYQRLGKLFRLMTGISYGIASIMTFFSKVLVLSLFGSAYGEAGLVLSIHIWSSLFFFLAAARSPWILNEGLMKISLYSAILGALSNVMLNLLLIPRFGPTGAALATLVSYAFSAFLFNAFLRPTRIIFFMQLRALFFVPMRKPE